MRILNLIVDKLHSIIHGVVDAVKEKIAEHRDIDPADLAQKLDTLAAADPQKLQWRTSIVDFLKVLDLDSDFATRKEMASELGRADYSGSADDNVWLHGEVFQAIIKRGIPLPQ